jgi:hypothetical protein
MSERQSDADCPGSGHWCVGSAGGDAVRVDRGIPAPSREAQVIELCGFSWRDADGTSHCCDQLAWALAPLVVAVSGRELHEVPARMPVCAQHLFEILKAQSEARSR